MNRKVLLLLAILSGCAYTEFLEYRGSATEPKVIESVWKKGNSYICSSRVAFVENPLDEDIVLYLDCKCGTNGPKSIALPAHKMAIVDTKSDVVYDDRKICQFDWNFKN